MKSGTLLGLIILAASFQAAEATSIGRTVGQFAVSATGSAQYTIPIWTPPGIHGVQPNLSLAYDSRVSYGLMGPGWTLSGLSIIARCSPTYAQDSVPAPITATTADGLCLDGNRLRTTGTGTYQTEIANFAQVSASGTAGNGPAFFTVQGKDGLTYEYGNTTDSRIMAYPSSTPYLWALDKVTDRSGNQMTVTYATGSAYRPLSIQYTAPNGSSTFTDQVTFGYTTKSNYDDLFFNVAGSSVGNGKQLSTITVTNSGGTRTYTLLYTTSSVTQHATLTSIQDTGLYPTTIGYQYGALGVASPTSATGSGATNGTLRTVDIDGDGKKDLIFATTNSSGNYVWWVQLASSTGYGAPISTGAVTVGATNLLLDDFEASGMNEILAPNGGIWYAYKWNASSGSFTATSTGLGVVANALYANVDVDGDGRPDLVYVTPGVLSISVYLNTSSSSAVSFAAAPVVTALPSQTATAIYGNNSLSNSSVQRFDFDGDGRQDLIIVTPSVPGTGIEVQTLLSRGTGPFALGASMAISTGFLAANWNDDLCTDLIVGSTVYLSGCNGAFISTVSLPTAPTLAIDWDGDGRTDALANVSGTWQLYRSQGDFAAATISTGIAAGTGKWAVTDKDGDGLDDLLFANSAASNAVYFGVHNGAGVHPDLATSFTDGYGNLVSPSYASLVGGGCYFRDAAPPTYPSEDFRRPIYVVCSYGASDGIGGTYTVGNSYYNSDADLQGRGWLGFERKYSQDSRNNIYHMQSYSMQFPNTGLTAYVLDRQPDGTTYIQSINNTFASLSAETLDATAHNQRYFPYVSNSTSSNYEFGGALNGQLTKTIATNWTYDNYGNATSVSNSVTDNDSTSPYFNEVWTSTAAITVSPDISTWCLGLPTEVDTTNTAPGVPTITRHVSFTPDYSFCRQTQQVVEPGNPTYQVSAGYTYDSFGNLSAQSVTGIGMAARTNSINWGTNGQFPTTLTNALGQVTHTSFDPNSGKLLSATDPNGLLTSWQYDDFGRMIVEHRPDGTETVTAYNDCSTSGGCLHGPHSLAVETINYSSTGVDIADGFTYFDQIDRPIMTVTSNVVADTYNLTDTRYDSLGNVASQSFPCPLTMFSAILTPCPYASTFTHDALNRLTQSQRPISSTNLSPQTSTYAYQGRTTTITDPQGKVTTTISKVTGKTGRTQDHNGYYVNFNHDAFGSLTSVTDSLSNTLRTMTYGYGLKAFRTALNDMDLGTRSWTYDALGEMTSHSDGKGQNFSATFDALSRQLTRVEPDLTTTWTWGNSAASFNIGKLASVSSVAAGGTHSDTYTYDSKARLSDHTIVNPTDGARSFDYAYDATTGLLSTLTYPASYPATSRVVAGYSYQNGFVSQIFDSTTPSTIWWQIGNANSQNQVTQEITEDLAGHPQIVANRTYDAITGWLTSIQTGVGTGSALQNESYLYDEMGNLTQRQNNNAGLTENFYYDNLYRLDHSTLAGVANLQMTYNAMCDITSRSDVAAGAAWTYDPVRKHAVTQAGSSAFTYAYDANGNVSSRNGSIIGWTSYNYPAGVSTSTESASFDYGPDRQRWRMIYTGASGTETTYYATPLFEAVYTSAGTDFRHYIYAGGSPVMIISRTSAGAINARSPLLDHQGSISSIVADATGTSLVGESFTAFGNRREASTWSGAPSGSELTSMNGVTREGYTFQTVLGSMGLNHMNGRVQDAVTGRFLSPDPRGTIPGNTQSWNRYSYVMNNPLSSVDPTGFESVCIVGKWFSTCTVTSSGGDDYDYTLYERDPGPDRLTPPSVPDGDFNPDKFPAPTPVKVPAQSPKPQNQNPLKDSQLCKSLQSAAANHVALAFDLAGAIGGGGALHVSVSADSINIFLGAGIGGGGEVGFTVGPAFESNTNSPFGFRTFATGGAGDGFGGAATVTAGTNGVSVNGGVGTVAGALAETGYGVDANVPFNLANLLCN